MLSEQSDEDLQSYIDGIRDEPNEFEMCICNGMFELLKEEGDIMTTIVV